MGSFYPLMFYLSTYDNIHISPEGDLFIFECIQQDVKALKVRTATPSGVITAVNWSAEHIALHLA